MYSEKFLSIATGYDTGIAERFAAMRAHELANIDAGAASDAERSGLPIRLIGNIAVIPLMGVMARRAGKYASMFGIAGSESVRLAVEAADADPEVAQMLLRVDSPGGSVSGMAELGDAVARATKPVTVQVEGMAASAAYYVASQADRIVAGRGDIVGSMGVIQILFDQSRAFENAGVETVIVTTGDYKSTGAPGAPITEAQRADMQRTVDAYFDDYVSAVGRGRGMSEDEVRAVADGRIFNAGEALDIGLIDSIGTLRQTLSEMQSKPQRKTNLARARLRLST